MKAEHSTVKVALFAIRSRHIDLGLTCELKNMQTLEQVREGIARKKRSSNTRIRAPVTTELLGKIRQILDWESVDDKVFFAMACLCTYGMFRLNEVFEDTALGDPGLRVRDVTVVSNSEFHIRVVQCKTDTRGRGATVELFANGSPSCPFQAFIVGYWWPVGHKRPKHAPLFAWHDGSVVKRKEFVKKMRAVVTKLGLDPTHYSGHSFRRGGATSLATAGVSDATIRELGRWKSLSYQLYVDTTKEAKAQASKKMAAALDNQGRVVFGGNLDPR